MRILVTEATEFIGGHVVDYLCSLGKHEIIMTATENKEEAVSLCQILRNTDYISKNLNVKEDKYYYFLKNLDCVIHLSWEDYPIIINCFILNEFSHQIFITFKI